MTTTERIRNAGSAPEVLAALSAYVETLRDDPLIPEHCLQLPLRGAEDVGQRTMALVALVNATSRNLLDQECDSAKGALRVFAAAASRLRAAR